MVNEVRYANEDNWHYGTPLGVWGGECTCPDGRVYTAGDQGNLCGSINCFGGTEGRCTQAQGRWAFREVHCARFPQPIGRGDTVLENQYSTAGIFGGTCTCPNGNVYLVGDRNDQCKSLSCEGGVSGVCNHYASTWSHRKVICAPSETSPPPEAPGCLDWCETDFVTPIETKCVSSRCKNCTFCPKPPPLPPPPPAFPAVLHPDPRLRRLPLRLLPARCNPRCPRRHRLPLHCAVTAPWTAVTAAAALASLTTAGETIAAARNTRSERGREEGREGRANGLKGSAAERGAVTDAKANFDREASTYIARRRHTRSGGCKCCRRISCSPGEPPLLLLLLCAVAPFRRLESRTEGNPEADPRRPQGAEAEAAGG